MDRRVYSYIATELAKDPAVEEGGKYVGYVYPASDSRLERLSLDPSAPALVVTDFLPSGPNATRTAVELLPDGEYQEALFRELERVDAGVEHVGTWHSHHCNGLMKFSDGDVAGYLRTVNNPQYRLEFFLASLVTRLPKASDDTDWIDHFLFLRGADGFQRITQSVRLIDCPSVFGALTGHSSAASVHGGLTEKDGSGRGIQARDSAAWYETAKGREVLSKDKRFFTERFNGSVVARRRGRQITMTGQLGRIAISVTYPSDQESSEVTVLVSEQGVALLTIKCDLDRRRVAFTAAVAAAGTI